MDRCGCSMMTSIAGIVYCDYFDVGFAECNEVKVCPDGYDEDEGKDENREDNEDDNDKERG